MFFQAEMGGKGLQADRNGVVALARYAAVYPAPAVQGVHRGQTVDNDDYRYRKTIDLEPVNFKEGGGEEIKRDAMNLLLWYDWIF